MVSAVTVRRYEELIAYADRDYARAFGHWWPVSTGSGLGDGATEAVAQERYELSVKVKNLSQQDGNAISADMCIKILRSATSQNLEENGDIKRLRLMTSNGLDNNKNNNII